MDKPMVNLIIDEHPVCVPAGTLIVDAAKQVGIDIPVFCYHPKMEPVGMCRMCLVEVGRPVIDRASGQPVMENGKVKISFNPKLETACTTPVSEGMVVNGMSDKAKTGRKEIVEFLLTSHPLDCPVCDKGGECPLQNLTVEHGSSNSRFLFDDKQHQEKHVPLGDLVWLDRERCIQCARCIRFQDEVAGEPVLGFFKRGRATDIVTYSTPGFDSVFSGNTTDICPVGALTTSDFRFGARPWEMEAFASICPHCPVGCNTTLNVRREARLAGRPVVKRVMPRQNEQVNEIWLCDKGRFAHHYIESPERISQPLLKNIGQHVPATWEAALQQAGTALKSAGKDVVVLAGGRLSNEDLFNLKALADGVGGRAILFSQMSGGNLTVSAGASGNLNFGEMDAETCILVADSDLYNEAPLWYLRVKKAAERGATLIVSGGRETKLEKYARHVIRHAYGEAASALTLLNDNKSGKKINEAMHTTKNLVILFGSDGLGLAGTDELARAGYELLKKSGHLDNSTSALIGVWQRANNQGAWELGFEVEPDLANAFTDKYVLLAGCDPVGDDPGLLNALKKAKFIVVQELFQTDSTRLSDVVLPAQAFAEREGTFTSADRRVQRFYAAVPAYGETQPDFAITASLASFVGMELEGGIAESVLDRIASKVSSFSGITSEKLAEFQEQWPVVGRGDIYYGGTTYANTQGLGVQLPRMDVKIPSTKEITLEKHPREEELLAIPVSKLYDLGITVRSSILLESHIGETTLLMHPETARRYQVLADGMAQLTIEEVTYPVSILVDESVPASLVLVPRSMGIPIHSPKAITLKAGLGRPA